MLRDGIIGIIRTAVPAAVGAFIAWLVGIGIEVDESTQAALQSAALAIVTAVYYAFVTLLERNVNPAFGWLLGYAKAPSYVPPANTPAPAGEELTPKP